MNVLHRLLQSVEKEEGTINHILRTTNTCLAIGPDEASKIDAITGELKLL